MRRAVAREVRGRARRAIRELEAAASALIDASGGDAGHFDDDSEREAFACIHDASTLIERVLPPREWRR